jgi:hypothetical protein
MEPENDIHLTCVLDRLTEQLPALAGVSPGKDLFNETEQQAI